MKRQKFSLELIEEHLSFWEMAKAVWLRSDVKEDDDFATCVCKLYVRHGRVDDVYDELKAHGRIKPNTPKTIIRDTIMDGHLEDKELQTIARYVFQFNKKYVPFN